MNFKTAYNNKGVYSTEKRKVKNIWGTCNTIACAKICFNI